MHTIATSADLKLAIRQMQLQQANELTGLKQEFIKTRESLRPINLIKSTFKKATASPDLKTDVFNAVIGLTTGILTKKLMMGKSTNPFKKVLGIVLEMVIANKVAKNADDIKSTGNVILNKIFRRKDTAVKHNGELRQ